MQGVCNVFVLAIYIPLYQVMLLIVVALDPSREQRVRRIAQTVSLRGPLASFVVPFIVLVVVTIRWVFARARIAKDPTAALGVCLQA